MNPQHAIVSGGGAMPADSVGYPWNAKYTIASGNLLADFRFNVTAESQGRLQIARLYNLTDDPGIKKMFSFLLARDTMHQNQWLAAIAELEADGFEQTPCPSNFPQELKQRDKSYLFLNHSEGTESSAGRWASGPSMDGKGELEYVERPPAWGPVPNSAKPTRGFTGRPSSLLRPMPRTGSCSRTAGRSGDDGRCGSCRRLIARQGQRAALRGAALPGRPSDRYFGHTARSEVAPSGLSLRAGRPLLAISRQKSGGDVRRRTSARWLA